MKFSMFWTLGRTLKVVWTKKKFDFVFRTSDTRRVLRISYFPYNSPNCQREWLDTNET